MELLDLVRSVFPRSRLRLIDVGAEAEIYAFRARGRRCILKYRPPKPYIHPELDRRLRLERTQNEVRLMTKIGKLGIDVPMVYANLGNAIIMERVKKRGKPDPVMVLETLHKHNIVHGDFTPKNFVGKYLIDFGLGKAHASLSDMAQDLLVAVKSFGLWFWEQYSISKVKERAIAIIKEGKHRKGVNIGDAIN